MECGTPRAALDSSRYPVGGRAPPDGAAPCRCVGSAGVSREGARGWLRARRPRTGRVFRGLRKRRHVGLRPPASGPTDSPAVARFRPRTSTAPRAGWASLQMICGQPPTGSDAGGDVPAIDLRLPVRDRRTLRDRLLMHGRQWKTNALILCQFDYLRAISGNLQIPARHPRSNGQSMGRRWDRSQLCYLTANHLSDLPVGLEYR